jgi:large subunit ribosomal protein L13
MKTTLPKVDAIERKWWLIDAKDLILGRMSVRIANLLRGRHKAIYTPHIDTGDHVIVINADKVRVTGNKEEQLEYMFYSGYFGNEKRIGISTMREKKPEFIIRHSVKGMLPKNRLAREMIKKLKIYAGEEHPHEGQNPEKIEL